MFPNDRRRSTSLSRARQPAIAALLALPGGHPRVHGARSNCRRWPPRGYRSFIGVHDDTSVVITPDGFAEEVIREHADDYKGKLRRNSFS
jgi:hypothetical protein